MEEGVIVDWRRVEDTIPDFRELLERKVAAKPSAEMQIPIARSHSPFLPVGPARILLNCRPKVGGRERGPGGKALHGPGDIDPDEDAADIKDNGFEFVGLHGLVGLAASDG